MFLSTEIQGMYCIAYALWKKTTKVQSLNRKMFLHLLAGIGICVQPLYIGEVAPKHLRGGMAMGSSIFLTGGILTGQIIGLRLEFFFSTVHYSHLNNCNSLQLPAKHSS